MRILVYGAGNLGCLYAARLAGSGNEVALLARGRRLARLREHGIVLENAASGVRTVTRVDIVERLEPGDDWELVLVVLPRQRVSEVLPTLAANAGTPSFMFLGNNACGPGELIEALGRRPVLLGFPGAAAVPAGDAVRYLVLSRREQPTTIGELDGSRSTRILEIAASLEEAGFPATVCARMDAWLKTHAAEVLPTVEALYMCGGDRLRLARTRDGVVLMLRAVREGYRVLRRLRVPITPRHHRLFEWLPDTLLVALIQRMLAGDETAVKLGHAGGARGEWRQIAAEMAALRARAAVPTPASDRLERYLDPAARPLADGSAAIPLGWRPGRDRAAGAPGN